MKKSKITFGKISLSSGNPTPINNAPTDPSPPGEDGGFGTFGSTQILNEVNQTNDSEKSHQRLTHISSAMGFSGFGKKAREFDIEQLAEISRLEAEERNRANIEKLKLGNSKEKEEDAIGPPLPPNMTPEEDDDLIGPPLPPSMTKHKKKKKKKSATEDSEDESSDEEENDGYRLPVSLELSLAHGNKAITSIAMDSSGSRLVSGSIDYEVKYWDFQGMDVTRDSFRKFVPYDGYPVLSVDYSCTGDKVLVVTGCTQAKVYDRDGIELFECAKGDMYLQDMAKTKGHIVGLTYGCWHPKDREEFLTASKDGTCRIWHTSKPTSQKHVIKPRAISGLKAKPTSCCYSRDGLTVACATDDGSIQMWDHRKSYVNTIVNVRGCHTRGSDITGISFSYDNKYYASRGGDDTLKLWDIRNPKSHVFAAENLFNRYDMTDCLFSPNDQLVVTGTSKNKGEKSGRLVMFNRSTWELEHDMAVGDSHLVSIVWHPKLNQICVGCGDGNIRILYDSDLSRNGAILAAGKKHKRAKDTEVVVSQQVITPHALPMFREERHRTSRKIEMKDRKDPVKSHRPELPLGNAGTGGRVSAGGSTLSSYIIRNLGLQSKKIEDDEGDPREALLKFAKLAEEDPYWVAPAYKVTQPKPVFREEDEDDTQHKNKKQKT